MSAIPVAAAVDKAGTAAYNLGTQRVIGFSKTKTYTKGKKNPKQITETSNVAIQAWEIAALGASVGIGMAGLGAYEFLSGHTLGDFVSDVKTSVINTNTIDKGTLTGIGLPGPTAKPNWWSNLQNFFKVGFA